MASSRLPVPALLSVLLFTVVSSVIAQNTPQDYLAIHNTTRSSVGVGPMVWNATVAAYAQSYALQRQGDCNLVHSNGPYGENLFKGSGKEWTALEAVQLWVDERQFYNYTTNTCAAGKVCGHYTQVVWRNSVNLGCARVKCTSGAIFITCNYSPRGNYVGQRPY